MHIRRNLDVRVQPRNNTQRSCHVKTSRSFARSRDNRLKCPSELIKWPKLELGEATSCISPFGILSIAHAQTLPKYKATPQPKRRKMSGIARFASSTTEDSNSEAPVGISVNVYDRRLAGPSKLPINGTNPVGIIPLPPPSDTPLINELRQMVAGSAGTASISASKQL